MVIFHGYVSHNQMVYVLCVLKVFLMEFRGTPPRDDDDDDPVELDSEETS